MAFYRIHRSPLSPGVTPINHRQAVVAIAAMFTIVVIPLTITSFSTGAKTLRQWKTHDVVEQWAVDAGWDLLTVSTVLDQVVVRVTGPLPTPDTDELAVLIAKKGVDPRLIKVEIVPSQKVDLKDP